MNVFDLAAKIGLDTKEYEKGLKDSKSKFDSFADGLKGAASKAGEIVSGLAKTTAAAVGAASTAFGALAKNALDARADYEQLVGGVDKLFGDASSKVQAYANKAFVEAGLSANEYMETVTGFSASLIASLEGDTTKAADIADRAIRDMSDNANTFGTQMQSIQNAYSGFAKGQFNMLDNLKLGYGGTKEEMQRLIEDASKMDEEMQRLNVTIDAEDMSFGNIINSISVMQEHLKIAGTTHKEAAGTVSGSVAQMKAAWKNFLTGTGSPKEFADSFKQVFTNVSDMMTDIVPEITDGLGDLVKELSPEIPGIVKKLLPSFISGGVGIITGLAQSAPELVTAISQSIPEIIKQVKKNKEPLLAAGKDLISSIFPDNFDDLPSLMTAATKTVTTLGSKLSDPKNVDIINGKLHDFMGKFVEGLTSPETLDALFDADTGVGVIVENVGTGLVKFASNLLDDVGTLLDNLVQYFSTPENIAKIQSGGKGLIDTLGKSLTSEDAKMALGHFLVSLCQFIATSIAAGGGAGNAIDWENDVGAVIGAKIMKGLYNSTLFGWLSKLGNWAGEGLSDMIHQIELEYLNDPYANGTYEQELQRRIEEGNKQAAWAAQGIKAHFDPNELTGPARDAYNSTHATGFYANRPTYLRNSLVGEAGDEVLLPLDNNTGWTEKLASLLNPLSGQSVVIENITVNVGNDGEDVGMAVVSSIDSAFRNMQIDTARSIGGTGFKNAWT